LKNKKVFVVTIMYRYGDHEKHSYVLGIWSNKETAKRYGEAERSWRGLKYEPEITEWNVDACECDTYSEKVVDGIIKANDKEV
jgi:hypothetical protein